MNFRAREKRRPDAALDMTPLIDVVFLLLIFFLVTTTFSRPTQNQESTPTEAVEKEKSLLKIFQIALQQVTSGAQKSETKTLGIFVDSDNNILLDNGEQVTSSALKEMLLRLKEKDELPPIDLNGDQRTPHGMMMEVLNVLNEVGVSNVNFVVEQPE